MSWAVVARKDFQDSVRSRWLWALSIIFVLLVALAAGVLSVIPDAALVFLLGMNPEEVRNVQITSSMIIQAMNGLLITPLVPLISLVVSHAAISGERESGSLKLLMALPHSREDVVLGKIVGRSATMVVAIVAGFVLPFVVLGLLSLTGSDIRVDVLGYFGYILLTSLLAVVFVCIGVGISASTSSQFRALVIMLAFYVIFIVLWVLLQAISGIALALLAGGWPEWIPFTFREFRIGMKVINPTGSFKIVSRAFLNDVLFAQNPGRRMPPFRRQISAVLMLLFWTVAPLALGFWRFRNADL